LADLQQILHVLHWSYVFGPIREGIRTHLIQVAIKYIIFYSAFWIGFVLLFWYIGHPFLAVGATVIYCGLIGGFVSSQRRMQTIPTGGDPLTSIYELKNGQYFLWFAPLTGGIFALVLMLIFMGRILQGIIFPEFSNLDPGRVLLQVIHGNNWVFTSTLLPKTSADYALLFLWSFIAGFAERFVPDAVDRLTTRAEAASQTPAATPAVVK
jgi:hypothetical protein